MSGDEVVIDQQTLAIEFDRYAPETPAHQYYRAISGQAGSRVTTLNSPAPVGSLNVYLLTDRAPGEPLT